MQRAQGFFPWVFFVVVVVVLFGRFVSILHHMAMAALAGAICKGVETRVLQVFFFGSLLLHDTTQRGGGCVVAQGGMCVPDMSSRVHWQGRGRKTKWNRHAAKKSEKLERAPCERYLACTSDPRYYRYRTGVQAHVFFFFLDLDFFLSR